MSTIKTDEQLYDVRLVKRHLSNKVAKKKEFEKYLKNLTDSTEFSDYITKELIFEELQVPEQDEQADSEEDAGLPEEESEE